MGLRLILTIVSPILHDFFTGVLHLILQFKVFLLEIFSALHLILLGNKNVTYIRNSYEFPM